MKEIIPFIILLSLSPLLLAGPPFQTDDPEPVPYHHGEIYFASQITQSVDGVTGTAPHGEINYGLLPDVQVHLIFPFIVNSPTNGNVAFGLGDIEFGVKYRFIQENGAVPQVGTFPHLEYPVGDTSKGLGAGHFQLFLPLWVQKSWGPWTTYGGGGYWIHFTKKTANSWFFGWELQRDLSAAVTTGTEIFMNSAAPATEIGFDVGVILNLSKVDHLLASVGRDIQGKNKLILYGGYQFTFGAD